MEKGVARLLFRERVRSSARNTFVCIHDLGCDISGRCKGEESGRKLMAIDNRKKNDVHTRGNLSFQEGSFSFPLLILLTILNHEINTVWISITHVSEVTFSGLYYVPL